MSGAKKCLSCKKVTRENQKCIRCDECHKWLHLKCSGLTNREFLAHINDPTLDFTCSYCNNYKCCSCNKHVLDNQNSICCDNCDAWTHLKCSRLTLEEFREFGKDQTKLWFCVNCRHSILPFSKLDERNFRYNIP